MPVAKGRAKAGAKAAPSKRAHAGVTSDPCKKARVTLEETIDETRGFIIDELICPISHELPLDPVTAEDGFIYERECIEQWLKKRSASPRTNKPMGSHLLPAVQVRNVIEQMVRSGTLPEDKVSNWKQRLADEDEIKELRRKAEEQVDVEAMCQLGLRYESGGKGLPVDHGEKVKWFQKAADRGHARAMACLGVSYQSGLGVRQDPGMMMYWFRGAAAKGDTRAMICLGLIFDSSSGSIDQNHRRAFVWFRKAANRNYALGFYYLGRCYALGRGVERDVDKGVGWLFKAKSQKVCAIAAQKSLRLLVRLGFEKKAADDEGDDLLSDHTNGTDSDEGEDSESDESEESEDSVEDMADTDSYGEEVEWNGA